MQKLSLKNGLYFGDKNRNKFMAYVLLVGMVITTVLGILGTPLQFFLRPLDFLFGVNLYELWVIFTGAWIGFGIRDKQLYR